MSDPLEQDQEDFGGRLGADPYFADITVLVQRKGVTENDIESALSVLNEKGGKIGAIAIIVMPELVPDASQTPGARFFVRTTVQVIEQPLFNLGDTGTGKSAEQIAERVRQILHFFSTGRGNTYTFDGMQPIPVEEGKISYGVAFRRVGGDRAIDKVIDCEISATGAMTPAVAEVSTIDCTGWMQSGYVTLADANGPVYLWLNINGEGVDPAPGGRGIPFANGLDGSPSAEDIALDLTLTLDADPAFVVTRVGAVVTITDAATGARTNIAAGTSGCTVATVTQGQASGPGTGWDVTITTPTAGATIYYTTDGSYPYSGNANATAYTAPFAQATAATIRAAAAKTGLQQSNVRQLTLT